MSDADKMTFKFKIIFWEIAGFCFILASLIDCIWNTNIKMANWLFFIVGSALVLLGISVKVMQLVKYLHELVVILGKANTVRGKYEEKNQKSLEYMSIVLSDMLEQIKIATKR